VFHTAVLVRFYKEVDLGEKVVIPWRGFRCFTQREGDELVQSIGVALVVIPWRGFRCFTRGEVRAGSPRATKVFVIPWRGFRCFTLNLVLDIQRY